MKRLLSLLFTALIASGAMAQTTTIRALPNATSVVSTDDFVCDQTVTSPGGQPKACTGAQIATFLYSDATDLTTGGAIAANAVALATDTTGDFVGTITGGDGVASTGATTGEDIDHTLSVDLIDDGDAQTASIATESGLEFVSGELGMMRGCADGEGVLWDEANGHWECGAVGGGGGGDSVSIDGVGVVDPDFVSTGDIDFVDTSNTITANLNTDSVGLAELDACTGPNEVVSYTTSVPTCVTLDNTADQLISATTPADAGIIRLGNAEVINWRTSEDDGNYGITVDATENLRIPAAGANYVAVDESGNLAAFGSGSISATVGDSATNFFATGTIAAARLPVVESLTTSGGTAVHILQQTGATTYEWDWPKARGHATDCTALTDGEEDDFCWERDGNTWYVCEPSAGLCDTPGEWTAATAAGDGVGYDEIMDEGSGLTKRAQINFIGASVNCVDNGGATRTDCTLTPGAEVNNLETTDPPNVLDTEVYIGTGAGTGAWAALSGDATMSNAGVVTVVDNLHDHTESNISDLVHLATAITDGIVVQADVDDTATAAGNPAFGADSVWFATTGLIWEGLTNNDFETVLTAVDPSADRALSLPDEDGTLITGSSVPANETDPTLTDDGSVSLGSDGANMVTTFVVTGTDPTMTVTATEVTFSVPVVTGPSPTPSVDFFDSDGIDSDINAQILVNLTDTGSGTEDADITIQQQIAGTPTNVFVANADGVGDDRIVLPTASIGPTEVAGLDTGDTTTGTFADARISETSVTAHEAALSIGGAQVDSGTVPAARVGAGHINATTELDGAMCGTNEILEDQGAAWACISTPSGGGESTTVSDTANGMDIVLSTFDITVAMDPSEVANQAPDLADLVPYEDVTDGNIHHATFTQVQTLMDVTQDDLSDDNPTALQNVTTMTDGSYCQGNASSGFDCDVTQANIPGAAHIDALSELGAMTCTGDQYIARNTGDSAWECVNESAGGGEANTLGSPDVGADVDLINSVSKTGTVLNLVSLEADDFTVAGNIVTIDDDSHAHVITNIDAFTVAQLQTQTSDVTTFYTEDTVVPVVDGGTGVGTSTGTGSVVLSNSPTLVTPALGTPASGVGTNLTGIDISAGTNLAAGRSLTLTGDSVAADAELYTFQHCVPMGDTSLATDAEWYTVWRAPVALTITEIYCEVTGGTNIAFDFEVDDGTPTGVNGSNITCTTAGVTDSTLAGDTTMAVGDRLDIDFGTESGTNTQGSFCVLGTFDD